MTCCILILSSENRLLGMLFDWFCNYVSFQVSSNVDDIGFQYVGVVNGYQKYVIKK